MPFFRPSLVDIRKRRISDFEYELGSQSARIPGTVEHALATSGAGTSHGLHGRLDVVSKNAFPHLADDESLIRWAQFYGVERLEAEAAEGLLLVSPVNPINTSLPIGTIWVGPTGLEYETTATVLIDGGNPATSVPIRARAGGAAGGLDAFSELSIQAPVANIAPTAVVGADGLTGGTDAETTAALRTRLLARIRTPPKGGGPGDYVAWAKTVPGVTRAWEFKWAPKVGYVTVLFMRDLDADPFPDVQEVADVQAALDLYAPICAPAPIAAAPVSYTLVLGVDLTLEAGADGPTVEAAIVANIQAMLQERWVPSPNDQTLYLSWISEAISSTPGELDHKILVPIADLTIPALQIPTLDPLNATFI